VASIIRFFRSLSTTSERPHLGHQTRVETTDEPRSQPFARRCGQVSHGGHGVQTENRDDVLIRAHIVSLRQGSLEIELAVLSRRTASATSKMSGAKKKAKNYRTEVTEVAERRSRKQMPRLELYAERGQQKKGSITRRSQWNAVVQELISGTIRRARSSAPLLRASTLLLILITLSLKPFFDGQKPSKNPRRKTRF
jgi:hypothetical protein